MFGLSPMPSRFTLRHLGVRGAAGQLCGEERDARCADVATEVDAARETGVRGDGADAVNAPVAVEVDETPRHAADLIAGDFARPGGEHDDIGLDTIGAGAIDKRQACGQRRRNRHEI